MTYIFVFTFGPVQSFISQARKSFDLYAGSSLLSTLSKIVMEKAKQTKECKILFPNIDNDTPPNRFLANLEFNNDSDVEQFGNELIDHLKENFITIFEEVHERVVGESPTDSAIYQIKNFLEVYWAALKVDKEITKDKYNELEKNLGSIKNIKQFKEFSPNNDKGYQKCTQCGVRDALFYIKEPKYVAKDAIEIDLGKNSPSMKENETLCSVCFMKRFLFRSPTFRSYNTNKSSSYPSTAEIAQFNILNDNSIENLKTVRDLKTHITNLKSLSPVKYDPQLLFEDTFNVEKERVFGKNVANAEQIFKLIKNDLAELRKQNIKQTPYYGIIAFDGDNMGKWVAGEYLTENVNISTYHNELTTELGNFANEIQNYYEPPKGKLVYCGGDDVLGYININYIFDVLHNLRNSYPDFRSIQGVDKTKESTASCGVCIAHYKQPLSEVLTWARKAEKIAKGNKEKDSVCFVILKRSGDTEKFVVKWDKNTKVLDDLKYIIQKIKDNTFSNSTISNISTVILDLFDITDDLDKQYRNKIKVLVEQCAKRGYQGNDNEEVKNFSEKIMSFWDAFDKIQEFISFLNFIQFINREAYIK